MALSRIFCVRLGCVVQWMSGHATLQTGGLVNVDFGLLQASPATVESTDRSVHLLTLNNGYLLSLRTMPIGTPTILCPRSRTFAPRQRGSPADLTLYWLYSFRFAWRKTIFAKFIVIGLAFTKKYVPHVAQASQVSTPCLHTLWLATISSKIHEHCELSTLSLRRSYCMEYGFPRWSLVGLH
ncbi:hypothetical protein K438DRAFT_680442 [Mycena galopus ATCC 62051]|nr:hypothetical protein K438DRAFT_680442 [Mycena galopus ATCC 62051]